MKTTMTTQEKIEKKTRKQVEEDMIKYFKEVWCDSEPSKDTINQFKKEIEWDLDMDGDEFGYDDKGWNDYDYETVVDTIMESFEFDDFDEEEEDF